MTFLKNYSVPRILRKFFKDAYGHVRTISYFNRVSALAAENISSGDIGGYAGLVHFNQWEIQFFTHSL